MLFIVIAIILFFAWAYNEGKNPKYKPPARYTIPSDPRWDMPIQEKSTVIKTNLKSQVPDVIIVPADNKYKTDDWFIGEWGIGVPSPAEQLIMDELKKYNAKWYREVSFRSLVLPSGGYARFDFYLPEQRCVIEYDSKKWHNSPDRLENDEIKSNFCRNSGIKLIRLNAKHYYKMSQTIYDIIKEFATMDWE